MTVVEAKKKYNEQLKRYYKAVKYFEREDITQEQKEENLNNYKIVLNNLNYLLSKVGSFEEDEVLGGFEI